MAIDRIPSGWDYAGEGIRSFDEGRERHRQKLIQDFQLINQLYASGAATADQLNRAGRQTGLPSLANLSALPSQAERRAAILDAPPTELEIPDFSMTALPGSRGTRVSIPRSETVSDVQAEAAGLKTPTQRNAERTAAESGRIALGSQRRQAAAEPGRIAREEAGEASKHFEQQAKNFIAAEVDLKTATAANKKQVVDRAFAKYKEMRSKSGIGQIPDEAFARSFFDAAYNDLLNKQHEMEMEAKIRLSGQITEEDRLFGQVTQLLNNIRAQKEDLAQRDKMLGYKLTKPEQYSKDPGVMEYNDLTAKENRLRTAQSKLNPKLRGLLDQTEPPAAAPKSDSSAAPAPKEDSLVKRMANDIIAGKASLANAKEVIGKRITQGQYDAIVRAVKGKTDYKAPPRAGRE